MHTRLANGVSLVIAAALVVFTPSAAQAQGVAAPGNVTASANGTTVTVSWSPPRSGVPQYYLVSAGTTPSNANIGTFNVGLVTSASGTLGPGTYYLTVAAVHAGGPPQAASEVAVTVGGLPAPPGAPQNLTQSVNGSSATFSWTAPSSGGTVASYLLLASTSPGGPIIASLPVAGSTVTVPGVPAGTYYVRVLATNAGGSSAASNVVTVTVALGQAPGAPVLNPPVISGSNVDLSWTPDSTGGPVTQVLVSASVTPGGPIVAVLPTTATSVSVPGVGFGSYYVSVTAMNSFGSSGASNVITVVVGPTGPTLTFTAPAALTAVVGAAYSYPFCTPDPGAGFCGEGATNPTGGSPPYHFQLDTLGGFPPFGLLLGQSGTLSGTPTTLGDRTFAVCAVDLGGNNVCRPVTMSIVPNTGTYQGTFTGPFTEHGYFSYWPAHCDWNATYAGTISMQVTHNPNGTVAGTATITGTVSAPQGISSTPTFTCLATTFALNETVTISGTPASMTWTIRPTGLKWVFTGALNGTTITGNLVTNASFPSGAGQFTTNGTIPVVLNKQ